MRQITATLWAMTLGTLTLLSSCDGKKPGPTPEPTPTPLPRLHLPAHLALTTTIPGADGAPSSSYLFVTDGLKSATYDNKKAIQLEASNAPFYHEGRFYAFPGLVKSSLSQIGVYMEREGLSLASIGNIPLSGGSSTTSMVVQSPDKAYITNWGIGTVQTINPRTLKVTKTIDLTKYAHKGASVRPSLGLIRDGYLFVGLNQLDAQWSTVKTQADIAVIDTKTDEVVKVISETKSGLSFCTRPIDTHSFFINEQGDIYANCLGSMEDMKNPNLSSGILRIKKGATDFDPDYLLKCSEVTVSGLPHKIDYFSSMVYLGQGKLLSLATIQALDPEIAQHPYAAYVHQLVLIDLRAKTVEAIPGLTPGITLCYCMDYDGSQYVYFAYATKDKQGIYRYDTKAKKVDPTEPYIQVQGYPQAVVYIPAY